MDYEKKYKEALSRAKSFELPEYKNIMASIFPELAESEDERIRKAIIEFFELQDDNTTYSFIPKKDILAWLEKQGSQQPTIIWHSVSEEPEEMKELFCEWESDDATWHDVAFYDEESKTFRHAKMPINVTKWVYVDELLEKQGKQKHPVIDFKANNWYVSKVDGKIHDMTYNPTDKVEPKFKVKYAGSEYNVLEVKDIAGVTFYGIEDEPNHIDYVKAENCEIISGYAIKENGSPYPTKPAVFLEQKPTWSGEDEEMAEDLIKGCVSAEKAHHFLHTPKEVSDWLKSLKNRVQPQVKEWSEEDELVVLSIEQVIKAASLLNIVPEKLDKIDKWLKSLKDRIGG